MATRYDATNSRHCEGLHSYGNARFGKSDGRPQHGSRVHAALAAISTKARFTDHPFKS
jgi:hypothetical protein